MIEPGMEFAPEDFRQSIYKEVKSVLDAIYATHGKGEWKKKADDQRPHCRLHLPAGRDAAPTNIRVLATPNLNGDYISDACAAQVGGLGIAPGANIGDGYAIFEATHGTAPKVCRQGRHQSRFGDSLGRDDVRFLGWNEAADLIEDGMERTIEQKKVTYDFERLMEGATKVKTSEFASYIIENMNAAVLTRRAVTRHRRNSELASEADDFDPDDLSLTSLDERNSCVRK